MNNTSKLKKYLPITTICIIGLIVIICIVFTSINKSNDDTIHSNAKIEDNTSTEKEEPQKEVDRFEGLTLTNNNVGIPVIYYHAVSPGHEGEELYVTPKQLKDQLQLIKSLGYTSLTMAEVNDYIKNNKPIPEKSILITFDDGYLDNYTYAFPILKELDMKATIFVIGDYTDTNGFYLTSPQIKEMSDFGIDIESHTATHVHLNTLSYTDQLKELTSSKKKIEAITGKEILSIAYPYGDYNADTLKAAKDAGYSIAFTTDSGLTDRTDNPVALNRIYVNSQNSMDIFKQRLTPTNK